MIFDKKNIANVITLSRIFGVGFIFWLTPYQTNIAQLWTIILFIFVSSTDWLDGWLARRLNIVSDFGKIMDPLADKILILVFLPLVSMHAISEFPVFVILAREFAIMGLRVIAAKQGIIISANTWGKIKTGFTLPTCGILMARVPVEILDVPTYLTPLSLLRDWVYNWPNWCFETLIWITVGITTFSFLDYLIKYIWLSALKKHENNTEKAKKMMLAAIPNSITTINLLSGLAAAIMSFFGSIPVACGLILIGALLDAMDGKLARKLGVYSKLGAKLDSNADFITFGVAPACILFNTIRFFPFPFSTLIAALFGIAFYASVHYRLNRFNKGGHSDYFEGYPSPGGASLLILVIGSPRFDTHPALILAVATLAMVAMISKWPYPHNAISNQKIGFQFIRKPTLVFWILAILYFTNVLPRNWYIPEILLAFNVAYLICPIIPLRKEFRQQKNA